MHHHKSDVKAVTDQMHAVLKRHLRIVKSKAIFWMLGVLLPCLTSEHSFQISVIDRTRKTAAARIADSNGICHVAELFQRNDLSKKLVLHKVVPTSSILNI